MPTVDGYKATAVTPTEDTAIINAVIDINNVLWVQRKNGSWVQLSNVQGLQGPTGPPGVVTQADIDLVVDSVTFGPWQTLALTSSWQNYGGGSFAPVSIRRNDYKVELRGLPQKINGGVTSGLVGITQTLPTEFRPSYNHLLPALHTGKNNCEIRVTPTGGLYVNVVALQPMANGGWITFDDVSWPLD